MRWMIRLYRETDEESVAQLWSAVFPNQRPKLNLRVVSSNMAVVTFYERLGYVVEERISMAKLLPVAPTRSA